MQKSHYHPSLHYTEMISFSHLVVCGPNGGVLYQKQCNWIISYHHSYVAYITLYDYYDKNDGFEETDI